MVDATIFENPAKAIFCRSSVNGGVGPLAGIIGIAVVLFDIIVTLAGTGWGERNLGISRNSSEWIEAGEEARNRCRTHGLALISVQEVGDASRRKWEQRRCNPTKFGEEIEIIGIWGS